MPAVTRTVYQALIESAGELTSIWADESSVNAAGSTAGVPVAGQTGQLTLRAQGNQAQTISTYAAVGGHPGPRLDAGALLMRPGTSGDYWGWEAPASVSTLEALNWAAADPVQTSHIASFPDGGLLAAGCSGSTATDGGTLWVWRRKASEGAWTRSVVWDASTTGLDAIAPCIVPIAQDRALLFAFVETPMTGLTPRRATLYVWETTNGGTSWTLRGEGLGGQLDQAISPDNFSASATAKAVRRLRGAYRAGQVLLVAHLVALQIDGTTDRVDVLRQWASDDFGQTLNLVSTQTGVSADNSDGGFHEVFVSGGVFVLAHLRADLEYVTLRRLGSAWVPLMRSEAYTTNSALSPQWDNDCQVTTTRTVGANTALQVTAGDIAIAVDDFGAVWMALAKPDAGNREVVLAFSEDYAQAWAPFGRNPGDFTRSDDGARIARSIDTGNSFLHRLSMAPSKGRLVMLAQPTVDTATTTEDSLLVAYLGGWSSLTLPPVGDAGRPQDRGSWDQTWLPIEAPVGISGWTETQTATSSATLSTSGAPRLGFSTTSTGTRYYQTTASFLNRTHIIGEWAVGAIVDGALATARVAVEVRVSDGTVTRIARVHLDTTGYRLVDANGGATLYTVTGLPDETRQYRIAVDRVTGAVKLWHRAYTLGDERRTWTTDPGSHTLSDAGAGANNSYLAWGHITAPGLGVTSSSDWHMVQLSRARQDSGTADGGNAGSRALWWTLSTPTVLRDSLFGRPIGGPGARSYVGEGVFVLSQDGPARRGETWTIAPQSPYPVERVLPTQNRNPRRQWRSATTGAQTIAVRWGGGDREMLAGLLGIVLRGANWRTGRIEVRQAGVWGTLFSIDLAAGRTALAYTRYGRTLVPNGAANDWYTAHELAGCTVDLGGGLVRYAKVTTNREGRWSNAANGPRAQLAVSGDLTNTSGTLSLWAPDAAFIVPNPGRYEGIRLVIDSQNTADGDLRLGQFMVGPCHVFPLPPSWGTTRATDLGYTVGRTASGITSLERVALPARRVEFAWTDGLDTTYGWTGAAEPDFVDPVTGGSSPSPGAIPSTPWLLEGLLRRSAGLPLAYLPRVPPISISGVSRFLRREELVVGAIGPEIVHETILGDELATEVMRVPVLTLTEEV